jgi:hypothetical protein
VNLGDMGIILTEPIFGDEYVRTILVARQEAWLTANPAARDRGFPPLLEWFIQPEDERFVQLPEDEPKAPPLPRQPRKYRSAASLREERDGIERRMNAIAGEDSTDGAIVNLSPHSRSRAARNAGRRRFAQMDRDLARYVQLRRRYDQLTARIAAAEARESAA